nr:hypothetical protein [uncultured Draconibacterium sp.]
MVALVGYLNRWNDSMGTEIENGAKELSKKLLSRKGWNSGKPSYLKPFSTCHPSTYFTDYFTNFVLLNF